MALLHVFVWSKIGNQSAEWIALGNAGNFLTNEKENAVIAFFFFCFFHTIGYPGILNRKGDGEEEMNEKSIAVLEQYELEVERVKRGRGAFFVETKEGIYRLQEYKGSLRRLLYEESIKEIIDRDGKINVDTIYKNREGELLSKDVLGDAYLLCRHFEGSECDVRNRNDILRAIQALAQMHNVTEKIAVDMQEYLPELSDCAEDIRKHNEELRRIRNYIRKKKKKTLFEYEILDNFEDYYAIAKEMEEEIEKADGCRRGICHGNYNYHNLLISQEGIAVLHFEHSGYGILMKDLYFFMRKILEKYDWNEAIGMGMLEQYDKVRSISVEENKLLKLLFTYPEKYWKVLNHYYNKNKSYLPDHICDKMKKVYKQQKNKEKFCLGFH